MWWLAIKMIIIKNIIFSLMKMSWSHHYACQTFVRFLEEQSVGDLYITGFILHIRIVHKGQGEDNQYWWHCSCNFYCFEQFNSCSCSGLHMEIVNKRNSNSNICVWTRFNIRLLEEQTNKTQGWISLWSEIKILFTNPTKVEYSENKTLKARVQFPWVIYRLYIYMPQELASVWQASVKGP